MPRLLPGVPLPPYSYVTGHFPHPTRDPAGHSAGHLVPPVTTVDPAQWSVCQEYLRGLDLFNYGYYWESHEAWEAVWHAAGRGGPTGDFVKGLIKLAAAGVKVREGRVSGTTRHARRAEELFAQVAQQLAASADGLPPRYMGLPLDQLRQFASRVAAAPPGLPPRDVVPPVERVFDFSLLPQ